MPSVDIYTLPANKDEVSSFLQLHFNDYTQEEEKYEAQAMLSLYYELTGPTRDSAKALRYLSNVLMNGNAKAQSILGHCYLYGIGVNKNERRGYGLCNRAAQQGDAIAEADLGFCYETGTVVEKDLGEALTWYERAKVNGNKSVKEKVFSLCAQLANTSSGKHMLKLGLYYEYGKQKNPKKAFDWYYKAAMEKDSNAAKFKLAKCYQNGFGTAKDEKKVLTLFKASLHKVDLSTPNHEFYAEALYAIGSCYSRGSSGVQKDLKAAAQYFIVGDIQGHALSQFSLGLLHINREVLFENNIRETEEKAVRLFTKAAPTIPGAQFMLGLCQLNGVGIAQNKPEAVRSFIQAAEKNLPEAQFMLGLCYSTGIGVEKNPKNLKKAVRLFKSAFYQKKLDENDEFKFNSSEKKPEEITEAEWLAQQWIVLTANIFLSVNILLNENQPTLFINILNEAIKKNTPQKPKKNKHKKDNPVSIAKKSEKEKKITSDEQSSTAPLDTELQLPQKTDTPVQQPAPIKITTDSVSQPHSSATEEKPIFKPTSSSTATILPKVSKAPKIFSKSWADIEDSPRESKNLPEQKSSTHLQPSNTTSTLPFPRFNENFPPLNATQNSSRIKSKPITIITAAPTDIKEETKTIGNAIDPEKSAKANIQVNDFHNAAITLKIFPSDAMAIYEVKYFTTKKEAENRIISWYIWLSARQDPQAQYNLGLCYFNGLGIPKNINNAMSYFLIAAKNGHEKAQRACFSLLQNAETGNNAIYIYNLAVSYDHGWGVKQNLERAFYLYGLAANKGLAEAQYHQAHFFHYGIANVEKNLEEALKLYNLSAQQGFALAQHELGSCYEYEKSQRDFNKAVLWYTSAAQQNYAPAQYALGRFYEEGKGVIKNFTTAFKHYREAANRGDTEAQYKLGLCYKEGKGTTSNLKSAKVCFESAARKGHQIAKREAEELNHFIVAPHAKLFRPPLSIAQQNPNTKNRRGSKGPGFG